MFSDVIAGCSCTPSPCCHRKFDDAIQGSGSPPRAPHHGDNPDDCKDEQALAAFAKTSAAFGREHKHEDDYSALTLNGHLGTPPSKISKTWTPTPQVWGKPGSPHPLVPANGETHGKLPSHLDEETPTDAYRDRFKTAASPSFKFRESLSVPARFMGARAAVAERKCLSVFSKFVLLFRMLEVCANCGLLPIVCWWVDPRFMIAPFILLWYFPAVCRTGLHRLYYKSDAREKIAWWRPWIAPLHYPVLLFTADDFSWLRLHPMQRGAWGLYVIYVARVLFMLSMILICDPHGYVLDYPTCKAMIHDDDAADVNSPWKQLHRTFHQVVVGSTLEILYDQEDAVHFLTVFWAATAEAMMFLSALWVVIACFAMFVTWTGLACHLVEKRNENLLKRIDTIATAIDNAMQNVNPHQCKLELQGLDTLALSKGGCKTFEFTTAFKPSPVLNPALVVLLLVIHIKLRLFNAYTFAYQGDPGGMACAVVLGLQALLSFVQLCRLCKGNPCALVKEVKISLDSGIFSSGLLEILKTDKGVLTLPALILSLAGLPWTIYRNDHGSTLQAIQAIAQIVGVFAALAGSGVFVFQQFDLGIEREGLGYSPRVWSHF